MNFQSDLLSRATRRQARVAFPEAGSRIVEAATERLNREALARPVLVGASATHPGGDPRLPRVAQRLRERRPDVVRDGVHALDLAADSLRFAAGLVALGEADALVAGAAYPLREILDAAQWLIGPAPGETVMGAVVYLVRAEGEVISLAFSVAGSVPTAADLARIGALAVRDRGRLLPEPPRVAFLSAGSHGSLASPAAEPARAAPEQLRALVPGVAADGEVEVSVALGGDRGVGSVVDSPLGGRGNVLVFPSLDAGQIAWQLAREIGSGRLIGPVLVGLARPVGALSRDASVDGIVEVAALVSLLGEPAAE